MEKAEEVQPVLQTISVPEAGRRLGIGRNAAYDAVKRGELPALRFGKRLVVPLVALQRKLENAS
jgi:excisionase family DNA binding protein